MTRTLKEICEQSGLIITPRVLRSKGTSVLRGGLVLSVFEVGPFDVERRDWPLAILWTWLAFVAAAWSLWWLQQGNEIGVFLVAASLALAVAALVNLIGSLLRQFGRSPVEPMTYALTVGTDAYASNFFESKDEAEVELVRAEIERVFAAA